MASLASTQIPVGRQQRPGTSSATLMPLIEARKDIDVALDAGMTDYGANAA
ncbi:MAG TPA: hypothetical protein VHW92_05770 [Mycobacteriales bacterium]|jgi:hypothetical protein|nr:hypothetical protein [Mycobacteriales bacterium]